ncbi:MAG: xanthine dehydrogenase family protein [Planctomycetes bacterium]|nr:xanthine dehydrogenase family protein [Planctomycetota bacterium]
MGAVGTNVPRKDSAAKVAGAAKYVDDISFPGMLHGTTIRATIPCGRIRSIQPAFDPAGFVVADYRDIPGENVVQLIDDDQPYLVQSEVRHLAEPILLVAHEDREGLLEARYEIEYDRSEPLLDPRKSTRAFKTILMERGDLARGFAEADLVVEGEYTTGHQEQLYIEPNGVVAVPEGDGIAIHGSIQCPYYVHKALVRLLALPGENVRVVACEVGGGFGGKEEYPSILAGHAAILALKARRPVKIVYDRQEDMLATTKRHPSIVRHRTGVKRDGSLTATEIDILMDGGAYATLSAVVLSRGVIHAVGPYRCENLRVSGRVVFTNTPPNGAFRGFGAPQTIFAAEVHMERIAEALGMDPVRLREVNALAPGDRTATGQVVEEDGSALDVLARAVERTDFHRKRREWKGTRRGIGLALFYHGSGFTGSGESWLKSKCTLELTRTGVRVLVASTEIGQGTRTMHAQIVADALGVPYEDVETSQPDTSAVPDSGPTVASRTCMVVGGILARCAAEMKERLGGLSPREYFARHGGFAVTKEYERPPGPAWDDRTYQGQAYAAYAWACDVAELELDPDAYEIRPIRMTSVSDIGKAIHPRMAAGQIEGGTAQGIGFATIEKVVMANGGMANCQLTNYTIPTTIDVPEIDVVIAEHPYRHGPFGAKGVGELPMDGPAPAIVAALRHLGLDIRDVPATPERILEASERCASS